jgi:hypothetical protein
VIRWFMADFQNVDTHADADTGYTRLALALDIAMACDADARTAYAATYGIEWSPLCPVAPVAPELTGIAPAIDGRDDSDRSGSHAATIAR